MSLRGKSTQAHFICFFSTYTLDGQRKNPVFSNPQGGQRSEMRGQLELVGVRYIAQRHFLLAGRGVEGRQPTV